MFDQEVKIESSGIDVSSETFYAKTAKDFFEKFTIQRVLQMSGAEITIANSYKLGVFGSILEELECKFGSTVLEPEDQKRLCDLILDQYTNDCYEVEPMNKIVDGIYNDFMLTSTKR